MALKTTTVELSAESIRKLAQAVAEAVRPVKVTLGVPEPRITGFDGPNIRYTKPEPDTSLKSMIDNIARAAREFNKEQPREVTEADVFVAAESNYRFQGGELRHFREVQADIRNAYLAEAREALEAVEKARAE